VNELINSATTTAVREPLLDSTAFNSVILEQGSSTTPTVPAPTTTKAEPLKEAEGAELATLSDCQKQKFALLLKLSKFDGKNSVISEAEEMPAVTGGAEELAQEAAGMVD
jgi:hypothetical protein